MRMISEYNDRWKFYRAAKALPQIQGPRKGRREKRRIGIDSIRSEWAGLFWIEGQGRGWCREQQVRLNRGGDLGGRRRIHNSTRPHLTHPLENRWPEDRPPRFPTFQLRVGQSRRRRWLALLSSETHWTRGIRKFRFQDSGLEKNLVLSLSSM